jgi:hypothetical protein
MEAAQGWMALAEQTLEDVRVFFELMLGSEGLCKTAVSRKETAVLHLGIR